MASTAQLKLPNETAFDREAFKARVRAVIPAIASRAADTERERRIPAETMSDLRQAGFFKVVQPQLFGGYEQDFDLLAELIQDIGAACASTAWVCGLVAAHQWLLASFPITAQHDVWDADPNALLCGSYAPAAKAVIDGDGYRISGRWSFASGCDIATWAVCAALLPQGEGLPPKAAFLLVPATDYRIDDDWNVVGLAGTGSKSLLLDNVHVPSDRTLLFEDTTSGRTPGASFYVHNPTFSVPMLSNIASCLASAGIGCARGALSNYIEAVGNRTTRGAVAGGAAKMAEFPTIQIRVAEATASVDAAREIILRDLRKRTAVAREGRLATVEERIESRRGQAFGVKLALSATEALNASTGGQGLTLSNPIQRAWRDVNAVGRHISFNWDAVGSMVGQFGLGLEPKGQY